jgi:hypothetical protein
MNHALTGVCIAAVGLAAVLYTRPVTLNVTQASHSDIPSPIPTPPDIAPTVYTLPTTTIVATRPPKRAPKVWRCGAPRALENDAVQTVRECGWIK